MDMDKMMAVIEIVRKELNVLDGFEFQAVMCMLFDEYARLHEGFNPAEAAQTVADMVALVNKNLGAYV